MCCSEGITISIIYYLLSTIRNAPVAFANITTKGTSKMASLKWVKISTTIVSDSKMITLQDSPQGKRLLLLWILLLCLAGELNQGGFFIEENKPYTIKKFKKHVNETTNFLNYSFKIFIDLGLLGKDENTYYIVNWDKHQSEDKLEKIRENARLRQQACRERHRAKQAEPSRDSNVTVTPQNKKENQNQNENIFIDNNPMVSCAEPTQPLSVANDLCVEPNHFLPYMPPSWREVANPQGFDGGSSLPPALTQTVTAFCEGLTEGDTPRETHTLLLAWLSSLKEKNRLPTTEALPLLLAKLPQAAGESGMNFPDYLREAICRGWNNFYPVPTFGKSPSTPPPRNKSYNIDELEAMI